MGLGRFAELAMRSVCSGPRFVPPVDIVEDGDAVRIEVEVPGVRLEDLSVEVDAHVLTVRGERRMPSPRSYHRAERARGVFARSFALPRNVDGSGAVAVIAVGVLSIRLPKRVPAAADALC